MTDSAPVTGRIFISYRREETAYPAGWLYDRLSSRFGGQVFKDVDSIQLGDDFVEVITRAVGSCDVLLALIGEDWLTITDAKGERRLDDPADFVRLEIEAALSRNVRVIPILVDGAAMPRADQLPESLAGLGRRQALELSPSRFETDTDRLLKVLEQTLADVRTTGEGTGQAPQPSTPTAHPVLQPSPVTQPTLASTPKAAGRRRWLLFGGGVAVLLILVLVAVLAFRPGPRGQTAAPVPETISPAGLQLSNRSLNAPHDPPRVGDTVTVSFTLTNSTDQPIEMTGGTFVAARDPADTNLDTDAAHVGTVLEPGQSIDTEGRIAITAAGRWQFWPCYESAVGLCPDYWTVLVVDVA
jgi:hypothetical protein